MADPTIYDQLAKEPLSDLTITQLNAGSSVTSIDQATIEYWRGPITLARILESSRTYAGGTLVIPETGAIEVITITAGGDNYIKPTGTEIWAVKGMFGIGTGGAATVTLAVTDGTSVMPFRFGMTIPQTGVVIGMENLGSYGQLTLSNSLWWTFTETGGANDATIQLAYYKVSL